MESASDVPNGGNIMTEHNSEQQLRNAGSYSFTYVKILYLVCVHICASMCVCVNLSGACKVLELDVPPERFHCLLKEN